MHEAQMTIRRLQARVRFADENSAFWADALADGVGMPADWRVKMKLLERQRGVMYSNDARVFGGKQVELHLFEGQRVVGGERGHVERD